MAEKSLILLVLFLIGVVFGSFLNVLIYRFGEGENRDKILTGRSYCPNCKTPIRWYDNIPLISYWALGGRCRHCGWKIPLRYLAVELIGGITPAVFYLIFGKNGWGDVISYTAMVYILLVISLIDWKTFEVPDIFSLGGVVLGLAFSPFRSFPPFTESLLAALAGFFLVVLIILVYRKVRGIIPLGMGDAKVLALIGAFEGFNGIFSSLFWGSLFALLFFLPAIVKNRTLSFAVPFVPFLALGAVVGLFLPKLVWWF
ncbi:MAG TPA: prepilin peptidase [Aquifex aeolicus]|nr:prepilin peptidase [Aquifex aeolicus]